MHINKKAFTLIELLVTVLIIGILAAIALPQYQKAIERSRRSEALLLGQSIKHAEERWYLITGKYTSSFDDLDININYESINDNKNVITTKNFSVTLDPYNARVYFNPLGKRYYDSLSFCFDSVTTQICKPTLGRIICSAYSGISTQVEYCKSLSKTGTTEFYQGQTFTLTSVD
jgi:type IV pilus assembly protein PilE